MLIKVGVGRRSWGKKLGEEAGRWPAYVVEEELKAMRVTKMSDVALNSNTAEAL